MIDNRKPLPDIEAALVGWLKADTDVTAVVPASKISTELPKTMTAEKRIQVFRIGGAAADPGTEVIDRSVTQANCFGATKTEANDVAAVLIGSYKKLEGKMQGDVFVSLTERITGPAWLPDQDTNIPRYVMTFGITAR